MIVNNNCKVRKEGLTINKLSIIGTDKLVRGGISGSIAGIVMEIVNYPLYAMDYLDIRPVDFSYMVITHQQVETLSQMAVGLINHLLFASLSGVVLSYILVKTNYQLPILKGFGLGLGTNIILLMLASFFNIKEVINISPINVLLLDVSAAVPFGITLGYLLSYWEQKFNLVN